MGPIDIVILIVLGIGLIVGFIKGFARQIAGLAGLLCGGIAAYFLFGWGYLHLGPLLHLSIPQWVAGLIVAVIAFIIIALFFNLLGRAMKKALKATSLGGFDRCVGAGLGLIKSLILILLLLMLFLITPLKAAILAESDTEPVLSIFTKTAESLVSHLMGESPKDLVFQRLEYWGFDKASCDKILQDPQLIMELVKSPKFFKPPAPAPKETPAGKPSERYQTVRKRITEVINDSALTARQKADRILELLHPVTS